MKTIYKYPIPVQEKITMQLPSGASIIRVEDVEGLFYLWAIVDPEAPLEPRYLELYKTGQTMVEPTSHLIYLGLCKLYIAQELGLYVFERGLVL